MHTKLKTVKPGLALVLLGLVFGILLGVSFGINEDLYKNFVATEINANPEVHDAKSNAKIWRYAQRTHFHATGIAAFSLGLILLLLFTDMKAKIKSVTSLLIGLGSFYPLAWLSMFLLAPSIGRSSAHTHILTEIFTYVGVGGLLSGIILLIANLFFGCYSAGSDSNSDYES